MYIDSGTEYRFAIGKTNTKREDVRVVVFTQNILLGFRIMDTVNGLSQNQIQKSLNV